VLSSGDYPGLTLLVRMLTRHLTKIFMDHGLYLYCNWDYIFISPPINIPRT
jgi:hypothetical protein